MIRRIHILGASGSGATTLGKALEKEMGFKHFDTDDYFWLPTEVPFSQIRDTEDRISLLKDDLQKFDKWVITGSLCRWGDIFIPSFDLVVFLWIPKEIRIGRLINREIERYGSEIEPGGSRYEASKEFIDWASKYDEAGPELRSKKLHDLWLSNLECPILRLEGDMTVAERMDEIIQMIK